MSLCLKEPMVHICVSRPRSQESGGPKGKQEDDRTSIEQKKKQVGCASLETPRISFPPYTRVYAIVHPFEPRLRERKQKR